MSDFRVIAIEDCAKCYGDGYVSHPSWSDYFLAHPDGVLPTPEADLAWFREQGHDIERVEDLPPEEIACPGCQTAGSIRREIPLLEALRQLNIQPQPNVRGPFIQHVAA